MRREFWWYKHAEGVVTQRDVLYHHHASTLSQNQLPFNVSERGQNKQQTMLKTEDGEEPSGIAMLREMIAACKSCCEEHGLQPVINIHVVNHYHGDIETYNNY